MREFRKARSSDAQAITDLYNELAPKASVNVVPDRIAEIAADPNTYLLVCDDDDEIIATALITLCMDVMFTRQPFAVLENVIVSSGFQRQGVGKSLMDHVKAFCLQNDCSKIMLLSNSQNRDARDFNTAMGYDPDEKLGFVKKRRDFNTN